MKIALAIATAALLAGALLPARAETFPSKPLRFVVPFTPGGAVDLVARVIGDKMSKTWNQTVVVENRPGAGSTIGTDAVAKAEPDGHTFLLAVTAHAINATLYKKLPYDPVADFAPVSLVATAPNVLVAHPDVPAKTVGELIAYAKANPGKLNFASPGAGTSQHLAGELFQSMAGIEVVHVPYKGTMPALTDLLRGDASYTFDPAVAMQYVREGKLKALGVTSAQRSHASPTSRPSPRPRSPATRRSPGTGSSRRRRRLPRRSPRSMPRSSASWI